MSVRTVTAGATLAAAALLLGTATVAGAAGGTSVISGTAWTDTDRDGVVDAGEAPRAGDVIYLESSSGTLLASTATNAAGQYTFGGLVDGAYRVEYDGGAWSQLQSDWTPTTGGSIYPQRTVSLTGSARADFGWRQIVRSSSPITTYVGPEGLTVESYNDVVTARTLYDTLRGGTIIGAEAPGTRVCFDASPTSVTSISVNGAPGAYYGYRATSYVTWASWVADTDTTLFHEYAHAASLYAAYTVQQDENLTAYLRARGLLNDPRLDSNHAWNRGELLAEDFRQRFGSAHAAAAQQDNADVPRMSAVPGLADFLATFRGTAVAPSPSPSPSASPSPSPSPSASASPSPSPKPSASPSPSPTATSRGKSAKH